VPRLQAWHGFAYVAVVTGGCWSRPRIRRHLLAGVALALYCAGIGFELYNQKAYDLSSYAGITFWARRAPGTASALRFAVTASATAPRGGQCHEYEDYSTCSDYFGSDLSLGTAFRRYSFTWRELEQEGWGEPHPDSVNTLQIYGIRFQTDPVEDFDFWIDDMRCSVTPTEAVYVNPIDTPRELFFGVGNSWAKATVGLQGYNYTDASFDDPKTQYGIGQAFVTLTPDLGYEKFGGEPGFLPCAYWKIL
jgi:hypothetical protein